MSVPGNANRPADGADGSSAKPTSLNGGIASDALERVFRDEWGRAVALALEHWPRGKPPANPGAWIVTTDEPEAMGLLALMVFHDSRRDARTASGGELVLLEDQDRSLWDRERIDEGARVLERALSYRQPGPYQLQAAIAALHAEAQRPEDTDWAQIAALYSRLAEVAPSPVVELNRGVAVAMAEGPEAGLALIDRVQDLGDYHLLHSARADLLRRLGRHDEAADAYRRALSLATNPTEHSFLERRLQEVS